MHFELRLREQHDGPVLFQQSSDRDGWCFYAARPPIDPWQAQFFVVRTDNWRSFCKDFFFPGLFGALKIKKFAEKILCLIASLIFDVLTFPIRCITLPARWISASKREDHPFHQYLVEHGADPRLLNRDWIYREIWRVEESSVAHSGSNFCFIDVPMYELDGVSESGLAEGLSPDERRLVTSGG